MLKKISKEFLKINFIILLCIIILFPLYYLLVLAFTKSSDIDTGFINFWFNNTSSEAFKMVLNNNFIKALAVTFASIFTLIIIRILIYSLAIAGMLKINNKKINSILIYFFIFISFVPEYVLYFQNKLNLNNWNLSSARAFSLITNSIFSFFIFTYSFKIAYKTFQEKNKIIMVDNLKWYEKIFYVYFSELKLSYLLLIIFTTTSVWNDFLWPRFLLNNTNTLTISIWFSFPKTQFAPLANVFAAGSVIAISIPLGIYLVFSKFINKTIT
ncbi:glycerol transporter subunit C [Mycoplasmopsis synoviae]|uniref:glycerol transporter subunit C n=1 Tax=Mycoplasmopsis synoviae TaxID=2109 RepID=UPI001CE0DB12|nr:glycerol transporter subunit C [Mycoplasmopsis synoviae]UBX97354.1 glycerol transporter subunit C [Mycoplasmopsis synoviae]UBX98042.1 glycerol transporter subunit C [Mycoplasmopsis synoviae]UBX98978.1 glycerol transporter subunit C [Mycoplasmopsis synoviae]UBX99262.1 glycerol transporter subunit C [Mycoplasmopsis synoviae]UBY00202.1 glycerol transporter subunit C [Mycoplasmopsis synoviae]